MRDLRRMDCSNCRPPGLFSLSLEILTTWKIASRRAAEDRWLNSRFFITDRPLLMKHGLAGPAMVADGWGARATVVLFRFVTFCAFALLSVVIFA